MNLEEFWNRQSYLASRESLGIHPEKPKKTTEIFDSPGRFLSRDFSPSEAYVIFSMNR
jgi:hypothetical protein